MSSIIAPLLTSLKFSFRNPNFNPRKTVVVATGKAATLMYTKFCQQYPDYLLSHSLLIVPRGYPMPTAVPSQMQLIETTHPQISEKSLIAGKELVEAIASPEIVSVVALVSGGSSAAVELLDDATQLTYLNNLVTSDKSITEINAIRARNSLIKGGKLAIMFPQKKFSVAVMSDIPTEEGYRLVGSMPFWSLLHPHADIYEVAGSKLLVDTIKQELIKRGYSISFSIPFFMDTHANLVALVKNKMTLLRSGEAAIIAGESTLEIKNSGGKGGRMSHLILSLIDDIPQDIYVEAFATDGVDGNSSFAGGVIPFDSNNCDAFDEIKETLNRFNSATLIKKLGLALEMKATGQNLNDIVIILKR